MGSSLEGPSSISPVGQEPKPSVRQRDTPVPQRPAAVLHVGDIVRGTVVELLSATAARIELPSGIVDAVIPAGQLHGGDTVMFRVQAIEPTPVLTVHAVAGTATELHEADVVRILGIQANPVTLEAVRALRGMKSTLTAGDVRDVLAGLAIPPGTASLREQIEIIGRMLDAGIPIEPKFYNMMESLFVGGKNIKRHIATLQASDAAPTKGAVDSLIAAVQSSFTSVRDVFRRFSMPSAVEGSVYGLLQQLMGQTESAADPGVLLVRDAAAGVMETMEAQQLYNIFALQHHAALVFHVLLPLGTDLIAGRLEIDADKQGTKEGPQAFRITTEMSALGEITASGFAVKKMLSLTILADTPEDAEFIDQYRDELARGLNQSGFVLQSLSVRDRQSSDDVFPKLLQRVNLVV